MGQYILLEVIIYLAVFVFWILKQQQAITTTDEFLSLGSYHFSADNNLLAKTFEASNASFATSFVGLFALAQINVFYALYIVLAYLIGIYVFAKIIIPKLKNIIINKIYYPQLIERQCGSKLIGNFISILVILSLLAFFYTEVFSFSSGFLVSEQTSTIQSSLISTVIVLLLAWYTILGGYRNVVTTDYLQVNFIRIGVIALFAIAFYLLFKMDNMNSLLTILANDYAVFPHFIFVPALLLSFIFSQLIYYDNWQRLILFYHAMDAKNRNIDTFISQASSQYLLSIKYILAIFSIPIFLAIVAKSHEITSLYGLLNFVWTVHFFTKVLVLISVLAFISALLSTIDTYLLGSIQVLVNHYPHIKLKNIRLLIIVFTLGIIPFIFLNIDIGHWLRFLFYSANVLVAPILLALLGVQLNKYILAISLILGLFVLIFYYSSDYIDLIAALTILFSFSINYILRHKQKKGVYA